MGSVAPCIALTTRAACRGSRSGRRILQICSILLLRSEEPLGLRHQGAGLLWAVLTMSSSGSAAAVVK
jgi:hypothetical protein